MQLSDGGLARERRWLTTLTAEVIEGLPDPDAARFHLALRELRIQGGQAIPLPSVGVTAIVGANNVGKSSVLAQLDFALKREAHQSDPMPKIVTSVGIDSSAEVQDLLLWLGQNIEYHDSQGDPGFATPEGSTVHPAVIVNSWPSAEHSVSVGPVGKLLVHFDEPIKRVEAAQPTKRKHDVNFPALSMLQRIEDSKDAVETLSRLSVTALACLSLPTTCKRSRSCVWAYRRSRPLALIRSVRTIAPPWELSPDSSTKATGCAACSVC